MPTTVTFSTLTQDVQSYLERGTSAATDPTVFAQIPRLINAAERKIAMLLKVQGFIEPVTSSFTPSTPVYPKPDRWRQTVSINFGADANFNQRKPLYPRSYEFCRTYWPDDTQVSEPKFYADYDYLHWLIVPTPDLANPFEAISYTLPPLLDSQNMTNWTSEFAPNLLLYGTLLEATPFLKNDERIPVWQAMYDREAQGLSGQDIQKILDRAAQRTRP